MTKRSKTKPSKSPRKSPKSLPPPTPEEQYEESRQARIEVARRAAKAKDILLWGRALFPEKFERDFCHELHGHFVSIRGEEFTSTQAPRFHAKTTIKCFLIPIFQALEEPASFHHYLNVQATNRKAVDVNIAIKEELETNEELLELYGDQVGPKWTESQFVLRNGVIFTALGAGESIRGKNYKNQRPDYIIIDDLYDEEDINNPEATLKKNAWFWGSLYPARAMTRRASIHVQGTAINDVDLLAELEKKEGWITRTFKAVIDWDKGIVLWENLKGSREATFKAFQVDRANMSPYVFDREMQNERRNEAETVVKHSWLYRPDGTSWEYDPAAVRFDGHYQLVGTILTCDPSIGRRLINDDTAIAVILKARYNDGSGEVFYIENLIVQKFAADERILKLEALGLERPPERPITECRIEAIAGFGDFSSEVTRRTNLPVQESTHVPDKITNLVNKSHFFKNGKVFLNKNLPEEIKQMLVYQLTTNFPKHDDARDAVLLGLDADSGLWNFVE